MIRRNKKITLTGFDKLINRLALESISIPVNRIDIHLKKILMLVGKYADVDRCYIALFSNDRQDISVSHEWSRRGFTATVNTISADDIPRSWLKSRKNDLIIITDVAGIKYPDKSGPERIFSRNVKSVLLVPLISDTGIAGYTGFSSVKVITLFSEELKSVFRVSAELILNLLEKKKIHTQLEIAENIVSRSTGQLAFFDRNGLLQFCNMSFRKNFMTGLNKDTRPDFYTIFNHRISAGRERFIKSFSQALAGRDSQMEIWIWIKNRKNLNLFEIFLHTSKSEEGGISGVIFNANDITERVQLEAMILKVIYQERKKIGINLHDDLGHDLLAIDIRLKLLSDRLKTVSPDTSTELVEIETSVKDMMNDVRRLSHGLIPFKNQGLDLREMLDAATIMMYKYYGLQCSSSLAPEVSVTDESIIGELYNIINESVVNSVKHSGCDHIDISIYTENNLNIMTITDNGKGIPNTASKTAGAGMEIMRYRARSIGGLLEINSTPGQGTSVKVIFNPERVNLQKESQHER